MKLYNRTVVICEACDVDDSVDGDDFSELEARGWHISDELGDFCPEHES